MRFLSWISDFNSAQSWNSQAMHFCQLKMESQIYQQIERIISNSYFRCAFPYHSWSFRKNKKHFEHKMFVLEWIFTFEMWKKPRFLYKEIILQRTLLFLLCLLQYLHHSVKVHQPVSALHAKNRLITTIN